MAKHSKPRDTENDFLWGMVTAGVLAILAALVMTVFFPKSSELYKKGYEDGYVDATYSCTWGSGVYNCNWSQP